MRIDREPIPLDRELSEAFPNLTAVPHSQDSGIATGKCDKTGRNCIKGWAGRLIIKIVNGRPVATSFTGEFKPAQSPPQCSQCPNAHSK